MLLLPENKFPAAGVAPPIKLLAPSKLAAPSGPPLPSAAVPAAFVPT